jgi:hypothetical protein
MNSNLSIEEIVLINNLLYAENLGGPRGTFLSASQESKTIGEYVNGVFRSWDEIDDSREYSNGVTGAEYKQILTAIRKNEHLKGFIIMQVHFESTGAGGGRSCFLYDPAGNEAIIAFKGTQSDAEWIDNVSGLYQVPTAFQQNALAWFQSLDLSGYDVITVTGHSKGGNKSKFITLMDDSVDNCFSFDGQGFSDEFIKEYAENIRKNHWKILNIIAESDFVNILLNDVGEKRFYLGTNFGRLGFAENHCANAILFFDDDDQASIWQAPRQDQKMVDVDKMLNSFIRSIPKKEKEDVANMLGNIIVCAGNKNTAGLFQTFSDENYSDSAGDLTAFILRYKEERPKMVASVKEILSQNGFDTGMVGIIDFITNHETIMELIGDNPSSMIQILKLNNAPKNLISFLSQHKELFSFIGLVSKKMRKVDPWRFKGDDLTPDTDESWLDNFRGKPTLKKVLIVIAVLATIILILSLCVSLL